MDDTPDSATGYHEWFLKASGDLYELYPSSKPSDHWSPSEAIAKPGTAQSEFTFAMISPPKGYAFRRLNPEGVDAIIDFTGQLRSWQLFMLTGKKSPVECIQTLSNVRTLSHQTVGIPCAFRIRLRSVWSVLHQELLIASVQKYSIVSALVVGRLFTGRWTVQYRGQLVDAS